MTIWLLSGYLRQIPKELEEAAAIDGMTEFQAFRLVFLPLAGPAMATTGILVFIFCWNEFMFALTFMNLDTARTVTVGTATFSGAFAYEIPWGLIAAGVVMSALPLIVLVLFFQKRIVEGLTSGSVKSARVPSLTTTLSRRKAAFPMTKFGKTQRRPRRLSEGNHRLCIGNSIAPIAVSPGLATGQGRPAWYREQDAPAFIKSTFTLQKGETSKDVSPLLFLCVVLVTRIATSSGLW